MLDRTRVILECSEFPSSLCLISEGSQTVRELVPHEIVFEKVKNFVEFIFLNAFPDLHENFY